MNNVSKHANVNRVIDLQRKLDWLQGEIELAAAKGLLDIIDDEFPGTVEIIVGVDHNPVVFVAHDTEYQLFGADGRSQSHDDEALWSTFGNIPRMFIRWALSRHGQHEHVVSVDQVRAWVAGQDD